MILPLFSFSWKSVVRWEINECQMEECNVVQREIFYSLIVGIRIEEIKTVRY